jgi:C1A family cysteine protease
LILHTAVSLVVQAEPAQAGAQEEAEFKKLSQELSKAKKAMGRRTRVFQAYVTIKEGLLSARRAAPAAPAAATASAVADIDAAASRQAMSMLTGLHIPADFLAINAARAAKRKLASNVSLQNPPAQFDWRTQSRVTPARPNGQGECGSCWCFTAVAAYESSAIQVRGFDPNMLAVSEQEILNCSQNGGCIGDWYWTAWNFMEQKGSTDETVVPYIGAPAACDQTLNTPYVVDDYGLVEAPT